MGIWDWDRTKRPDRDDDGDGGDQPRKDYSQITWVLRPESAERAQQYTDLMDEFGKYCNKPEPRSERRSEIEQLSGVPDEFIRQCVCNLGDAIKQDPRAISIAVQFGIWIGQRIAVQSTIDKLKS